MQQPISRLATSDDEQKWLIQWSLVCLAPCTSRRALVVGVALFGDCVPSFVSCPYLNFSFSSYMIENQKETPQEKTKSTPIVIVIVIVFLNQTGKPASFIEMKIARCRC